MGEQRDFVDQHFSKFNLLDSNEDLALFPTNSKNLRPNMSMILAPKRLYRARKHLFLKSFFRDIDSMAWPDPNPKTKGKNARKTGGMIYENS